MFHIAITIGQPLVWLPKTAGARCPSGCHWPCTVNWLGFAVTFARTPFKPEN